MIRIDHDAVLSGDCLERAMHSVYTSNIPDLFSLQPVNLDHGKAFTRPNIPMLVAKDRVVTVFG